MVKKIRVEFDYRKDFEKTLDALLSNCYFPDYKITTITRMTEHDISEEVRMVECTEIIHGELK